MAGKSADFKSYIVWDKKVIHKVLNSAEKSLIAAGIKIERKMKKYLTSGEGAMTPAVDTGRLRASISTNWSASGLTSGNVFKVAMSGGVPSKSGVITMNVGDAIGQPAGKGSNTFTVVVGTNVYYAPHVEFGTTRGMPARPYLKMAYQAVRPKVAKIIKDTMNGTTYGGTYKGTFTQDVNSPVI